MRAIVAIQHVMTRQLQKLDPDGQVNPELLPEEPGASIFQLVEATAVIRNQNWEGSYRYRYILRLCNSMRESGMIVRLGEMPVRRHHQPYRWRLSKKRAEWIARSGIWKEWAKQWRRDYMRNDKLGMHN